MQVTGTHINYHSICHRKLWLFINGIRMEHTSQAVAEGRLIGETTYPQRAEKGTEIELSYPLPEGLLLTGKIDFYDARNKTIHETKKSDCIEEAHEWQVKAYIWLLQLNGIAGVTGIIEYPRLRHTSPVVLTDADIAILEQAVKAIAALSIQESCPPRINSKVCKRCSYFDFCYVEEA